MFVHRGLPVVIILSWLVLWYGLNEMMHVKLSAQCLAHSKCSTLSIIIINFKQHFEETVAGIS